MVNINEIIEPKSQLFFNDELVGEITSHLQLNDCLLQIFRERLEGYYIIYEGEKYPIKSNGKIENASRIYPLLTKQMKELMGF